MKKKIRDPVCGMEVEKGEFALELGEKKFYFCSRGCLEKFKESPSAYSEKQRYELIIIGAGPAGLTAGVYASILKIDTLLLSKDIGGQAVDSTKIKNYMGYDFITGPELTTKFQDQLIHEHYIDHQISEVMKIDQAQDEFEIITREGGKYKARAVIVATGMMRRKLDIPGEHTFQRRGVSYRAVQDMTLFSGLPVAVIGGGNSGIQTALELARMKCEVFLLSHGPLTGDPSGAEKVKTSRNITVYEGYEAREIQGKDNVEALLIVSRDTGEETLLACRGVFIQVGLLANSAICSHLVEVNEKGEIIIKPDCSTSREGIFACGDVTDAFGKRIVIASGEGAKAALAVHRYLLKQTSAINVAGKKQ